MLHALIMAGGSGTRFWPSSTKERPKQFLNIFGERTMLQETFDRIEPMVPAERTWIITNERYVGLVKEQLPEVPEANIIGEPVARNTAPCVAIGAALVSQKDPDGTMIVLPADHHITGPEAFLSLLNTAASKAESNGGLVTIGIKPDRPETGYGYIESEPGSGETLEGNRVMEVNRFREKPDEETARSFLEAGNYFWNSGMFIWQADTILNEFRQHLPEVYSQIETFLNGNGGKEGVRSFYEGCPSISIDYGIMEKAGKVYVVPGEFGWNDVGSWRAVYGLRDKDNNGNAGQAEYLQLHDSRNNLIKSDSGKVIALVGVENMAVVETEKAILVCRLGQAQDVKKIVEALGEDENLEKFL